MGRTHKMCGVLLCLLAVLSMCLHPTAAWQSLEQTAENAIRIDMNATDAPVIEKVIEGADAPQALFEFVLRGKDGAPMPGDLPVKTRRVYLEGEGSVKLGTFSFGEPGVYLYTLTETEWISEGWTFDKSVYTLKFTVTPGESGGLTVKRELFKDGEPAARLVFRNKYSPPVGEDEVEITGRKIWFHGENPPEKQPDSVVVYVFADGELVLRQRVTAAENWEYSFILPKYDGQREIVYTLGEEEVPGYMGEVDGENNLINRFVGAVEPSPTPIPTPAPSVPPSHTPTPPDEVQTGDRGELGWWIAVTVFGAVGLALCLGYLYYSKHRYVGKRLRKG